jgi:hypothetical protein
LTTSEPVRNSIFPRMGWTAPAWGPTLFGLLAAVALVWVTNLGLPIHPLYIDDVCVLAVRLVLTPMLSCLLVAWAGSFLVAGLNAAQSRDSILGAAAITVWLSPLILLLVSLAGHGSTSHSVCSSHAEGGASLYHSDKQASGFHFYRRVLVL